MTTGQWLRYLSNVDGITALDHFESIRRTVNAISLTINGSCMKIKDENTMVLYDSKNDTIQLSDDYSNIVQIGEEMLRIEDKEVLHGIC